MPDTFNFDIEKTWEQNLAALKDFAISQDSKCAELMFENLATLMIDDGTTGRRDFNHIILTALNTLSEAESAEGTE
jgi:hypothetical protein